MITPLPEPHYFVVVGYDGRETHQPYYLLSDLERYGEAEYRRGIAATANLIEDFPYWIGKMAKLEISTAIRKLGEAK